MVTVPLRGDDAPSLRVSSAELVRNISYWQERALEAPITITYHGRDRLIMGPSGLLKPVANAHAPQTERDLIHTSFELLKDNVELGYLVHDRERRVLDINLAAQVFYGVSREEALGNVLEKVLNYATPKPVWDAFERVLRTGEVEEIEQGSALFPGRVVHIRMYPHPQGVAMLVRNVTRLVDTERQLSRTQSAMDALQHMHGAAAFSLDATGHFTTCGDSLSTWLGIEGDALLDASLSSIVATRDRSALTQAMKTVMMQNQVSRLEIHFLAKSGEEVAAEIAMSPLISGLPITGICGVTARLPSWAFPKV